MVGSLLSPFFTRLNLGIDMTGGIQVEYSVSGWSVDAIIENTRTSVLEAARATLTDDAKKVITDAFVYRVSGTDKFVVEAGINEEGIPLDVVESAKTAFVTALDTEYKKITDAEVTQSKYVNIGASFGSYIKKSGFLTLGITIIAISVYIMYAFSGSIAGMSSWPFALVTGASLAHDVIVAFGLYVLTSFFFPEFKIDTFFLTAMLTILGYSINDTIVVMDRIRSNLESNSKTSFSVIIDKSIHDTMRRSIFTSMTVIIVLVAMFFFGPDSLRGFTLALIYGGLVGTYSSVCLASPLLVDITGKK